MALSDLAQLGEFVGGLAVLLTLIYLAAQLRENTRVVRSAALDETQRISNHWRGHLLESPALAALWLRGQRGAESLDEVERLQFETLLQELFYHFQSTFLRARSAGDPEHWSSFSPGYIGRLLQQPGVASFWSRHRDIFFRDFAREIDRLAAMGR